MQDDVGMTADDMRRFMGERPCDATSPALWSALEVLAATGFCAALAVQLVRLVLP